MSNRLAAIKQLQNQHRDLLKDPSGYFKYEIKGEDIFDWTVWMHGTGDTAYEGGIFKLSLKWDEGFPFTPPSLHVVSDFWHPNVYPDGKVCISILHPPGNDPMSGERPEERWLPIHTAETIMLSFMSMLADPNCSSPANVDSSVQYRRDRKGFNARVKKLVKKANKEVPEGLVIPKEKKRMKELHMMGCDCETCRVSFPSDEELEYVIEDDDSDDVFSDEGEISLSDDEEEGEGEIEKE